MKYAQKVIDFAETLNVDVVKSYKKEVDKLLWIEYNILDHLELPGISTYKGFEYAEIAEDVLEKRIEDERI